MTAEIKNFLTKVSGTCQQDIQVANSDASTSPESFWAKTKTAIAINTDPNAVRSCVLSRSILIHTDDAINTTPIMKGKNPGPGFEEVPNPRPNDDIENNPP